MCQEAWLRLNFYTGLLTYFDYQPLGCSKDEEAANTQNTVYSV